MELLPSSCNESGLFVSLMYEATDRPKSIKLKIVLMIISHNGGSMSKMSLNMETISNAKTPGMEAKSY